jgi:putative tryptophan/tyrosine transport system substrate-binding protein
VSTLSRRQVLQGAGVVGLALVAGCGRWPGQAPAKVYRIGILHVAPPGSANIDAFRQGLRELGYIEGYDVVIAERSSAEHRERLPDLARELVQLDLDAILVWSTPAVQAAKAATWTIPLVMVEVGDPVGAGLVASLSRPGGNVTGLTHMSLPLAAKRLELLKEAAPGISRVGILWNPMNPLLADIVSETQAAAQVLGIRLLPLEVRQLDDLERAFDTAVSEHVDALVVPSDALANIYRARIAELAAKHSIAVMYDRPDIVVDVGGLMAYGPDRVVLFRRAATYVDKILKGAKPADLPIEQPMRFDFVINLRTAQMLGLTIPPHVLLQATEVIQ